MKNFFEKHETLVCMLLIVIYLVVNSFCMQNFGLVDYRTFAVNTTLSIMLVILMLKLKKTKYYGLAKITNPKEYLYFLPLLLIVSVNLWNGFNINYTTSEIVFYILNMINIGFLEEIIFRGFLFKMMAKDNVNIAIVVSAVTFGIGHIINLFNGGDVIGTLLQVCYAISIGYLFVIIFHKSKSLLPCIITHCLVNSLSVFNMENSNLLYLSSLFLIVAPLIYAIYLNKNIKD